MAKCLDCGAAFCSYGGTKMGTKCFECGSDNIDITMEVSHIATNKLKEEKEKSGK